MNEEIKPMLELDRNDWKDIAECLLLAILIGVWLVLLVSG